MTTEPAPINEFSPISIPGRSVEFAPIFAFFFMVAPLSSFFAFGESGYFAFVMTTLGPIQLPSSKMENSGMKACVWILTLFFIKTVVLSKSFNIPLEY